MTDADDAASNNPAGRVLWFLRQLEEQNRTSATNQHIADTVAIILGTEVGSTAIYRAVTQVRDEIDRVPELMLGHTDIAGYRPIFRHYKEILGAAKKIQLPDSYNLSQAVDPISDAG